MGFTYGAAIPARLSEIGNQGMEIVMWCKYRFEMDGYKFVPDFITGPDVEAEAHDAWQFNEVRFRSSLLQLKVMRGAIMPETKLADGDWVFSGSTSGDGLGRLTVTGPEGQSQTVVDSNTVAVFRWNDEPHAITGGTWRSPGDNGLLQRLYQNEDRTWSAKPLLRLTGVIEAWLAPNQTIGILGHTGVMLIRRDGTPEWVGCPAPTFP